MRSAGPPADSSYGSRSGHRMLLPQPNREGGTATPESSKKNLSKHISDEVDQSANLQKTASKIIWQLHLDILITHR
jgi:hypothetical protein